MGLSVSSLGSAGLMRKAHPSSALWGAKTEASTAIELFGVTCANETLQDAAADLVASAIAGRSTRVAFMNAHVANCCRNDPAYHRTIASADKVYADGSGMAIAARLAGERFIDNVNGTDLFPELCRQAAARGVKLFLLGGRPGIAEAARATIAANGLGAAIAGCHHGYFAHGGVDEATAIAAVNASGAELLLVGMGVPLQDQWIERNRDRLSPAVTIGVGGLFDYFSGRIPRAPHLLRSIGLEWAWRLAQEPRRMARRYLVGNVTFLAAAVRQALKRNFESAAGQPIAIRSQSSDGGKRPLPSAPEEPPLHSKGGRLSRRVALDCVRMIEGATVAGAGIAVATGIDPLTRESGPAAILAVCGCAGLATTWLMAWRGLYDPTLIGRLPIGWRTISAAAAMSITVAGAAVYGLKFASPATPSWLAMWFLSGTVSIIAVRLAARHVLAGAARRGRFDTAVALIGVSPAADELAGYLRERPHGLKLVGLFDDRPAERTGSFPNAPRTGTCRDLVAICRAGGVDRVVIALPPTATRRIAELTVDLERLPVSLDICGHLLPELVAEVRPRGLEQMGPVGLISIKKAPLADWGGVLKATLDYAIALALVPVLVPLFGIIAVAIKLDSKGPIFFRQTRKGYNQRPFKIWKFRTMTVLEDGGQIRQATKGDARVTRVGAVLRRTSLDELPQIINVLRAEMSIVGPRPHALAHDNQWEEEYFRYVGRQQVKPGITGWAQVHGFRGELDGPEKLKSRIEYDVEYVRTWSIWLDLKILALTPFKGFVNKNAY